MADQNANPAIAIMMGGNGLCFLNIIELLIEKRTITRSEGASVFTKTANQMRDGTEDDPTARHGELAAQQFESLAAICLGIPSEGS